MWFALGAAEVFAFQQVLVAAVLTRNGWFWCGCSNPALIKGSVGWCGCRWLWTHTQSGVLVFSQAANTRASCEQQSIALVISWDWYSWQISAESLSRNSSSCCCSQECCQDCFFQSFNNISWIKGTHQLFISFKNQIESDLYLITQFAFWHYEWDLCLSSSVKSLLRWACDFLEVEWVCCFVDFLKQPFPIVFSSVGGILFCPLCFCFHLRLNQGTEWFKLSSSVPVPVFSFRESF